MKAIEIAELLGVTDAAVFDMRARGDLSAERADNGRLTFDREEVIALAQSRIDALRTELTEREEALSEFLQPVE